MGKDDDLLVIDFLKDAISYVENRISLIDNRASILITGIGVFFALFTYIIKDELIISKQSDIIIVSNLVLGVSFFLFII